MASCTNVWLLLYTSEVLQCEQNVWQDTYKIQIFGLNILALSTPKMYCQNVTMSLIQKLWINLINECTRSAKPLLQEKQESFSHSTKK